MARPDRFRLTLTGVGAMNSPRFWPAGLLVEYGPHRVMMDGGPGSAPEQPPDAWLVTDARAELIREIRTLARRHGTEPVVASFIGGGLAIDPQPVIHTSHDTYGYLIAAEDKRIAWAPEFFEFPAWAGGVDLLLADGAGWDRPIRFAGGVGGHAAALDVAERARGMGVQRLVFAHIGRPTIRAIDTGRHPPLRHVRTGRCRLLPQAVETLRSPITRDPCRAATRGWASRTAHRCSSERSWARRRASATVRSS